MATISARTRNDGKRYYTATVRRGAAGKSFSKSFNQRRDADAWARDVETAIQKGELMGGSLVHSLNQLFDEYTSDAHFRSLRAQAVRLQQIKWWRGEIGEKRLGALTDVDVQRCLRKLLRHGSTGKKALSPTTVNRFRATLGAAMEFARRELKWIKHNPVTLTRKQKEPRGRTRFLSDDERGRLLGASRSNDDLYLVVLMALTTGARQGEIIGARWRHIDLKARTWLIPHTKNDDPRLVPLAHVVIAELAKRVHRLPPFDYLFAHKSNPKKQGTFPDKPWRHARKAAELEDFRFHDLRHTAASYLAQNGASTRQLADLLGHKTLAMVQRYSHLTIDSRRDLVDFLDSKVTAS